MLKNYSRLVFITLFISQQFAVAQNTVGTVINNSGTFNGYTLFSPLNNNTTTFLIDNCGQVVHQWESQYAPGNSVYLMDDGKLIRTGKVDNVTIAAGGGAGHVEILDWDSNVLWDFTYSDSEKRHHHDIAPMSNGNILILAWEVFTKEEAISAGRNPDLLIDPSLWPEHIIEVNPSLPNADNIVWEWHLWDHLIQDFDDTKSNFGIVEDHPELVDINFISGNGISDWIHANAIDYNEELDQIMISARALEELWIIDHSTTTEEAKGHTGGTRNKGGDLIYRWGNPQVYGQGTEADKKFFGQHDTHWIESGLVDAGKIMIFNNGLRRPDGSYTSIEILNPQMDNEGNYIIGSDNTFAPSDTDWKYTADNPTDFYSRFISGAQRLPNGNTLICSGASGSFIEINPEFETVWTYVNPIGIGDILSQGDEIDADGPANNLVFRATKFGIDLDMFQDNMLVVGDRIELNPSSFVGSCGGITSIDELSEISMIFPNPASSYFKIQNYNSRNTIVSIYDIHGSKSKLQAIDGVFDISDYSKGLYVIVKENGEKTKLVIE